MNAIRIKDVVDAHHGLMPMSIVRFLSPLKDRVLQVFALNCWSVSILKFEVSLLR